MNNPIHSHRQLRESVLRYIKTAFGTRSPSFEAERERLLERTGGVFQEPYIEPLLPYRTGKTVAQLTDDDFAGQLNLQARKAFFDLCNAKLFAQEPGQGPSHLYLHQSQMLRDSLSGKHCVVTTGTGSGKTEAFLLPLIASLLRECPSWAAATPSARRQPGWWTARGARWDADKRRSCWGEKRKAAIRSLILYPMNALVEDQVSRLRDALDSDETHGAYHKNESFFQGNRITFARFNGETPVPGHPFKAERAANGAFKPNTSARNRLGARLRESLATYQQLRQERDGARQAERNAPDPQNLEKERVRREDAEELMTFFPRIDDESVEMLHRWEMQRAAPDIFITNFSMLSIMLMRQRDPAIPGDQADVDMIDETNRWLAGDPCRGNPTVAPTRVFHLVVDELHLYRGTAGTEVAYLIRLLLHRLGLEPCSPQLRILASSASLDLSQNNAGQTYAFLAGFFGFTEQEARARFSVIEGEKEIEQSLPQPALPAPSGRRLAVPSAPSFGSRAILVRPSWPRQCLRLARPPGFGSMLTSACVKEPRGTPRAVALGEFSGRFFQALPTPNARRLSRVARAIADARGNAIPRFRFHWMARSVDGIWASLDQKGTARKTNIYPLADCRPAVWRMRSAHRRRRKPCPGRFCIATAAAHCSSPGYRCEAPGRNPRPGQPPANGIELLPTSPRLENLPVTFPRA